MTPRLAALATWCREAALPVSVLVCIAASGFTGIGNTSVVPSVGRALSPMALATADLAAADSLTASKTVAEVATPAAPQQPVVTAALTDSSEMLPPVLPLQQDVAMSPAGQASGNTNPPANSTEASDGCPAADTCVDHYLWALYQRAPKEDSVKTQEQRTVTVKKKGKLVTVTKNFTIMADEDFSWKDPKAAEMVGMPMMDYVIGGMDRDFKLKLSQMLRAAEDAGLSPGITSAFRDDYRQSIASGLKAANDRSYHGGSTRGGYGHGLAADLVSVNGETRAQRLNSTHTLWKWIDAHGKEFGIGRPYLGKDPMHVAPIDGKEYADHRPAVKPRRLGSETKPGKKLVSGNDRSRTEQLRTARSS